MSDPRDQQQESPPQPSPPSPSPLSPRQRPLPQALQPQSPPPAPPSNGSGKTPAELALEREGGEILPQEFRQDKLDYSQIKPIDGPQAAPAQPAAATEAPQQRVIDMRMGVLSPGSAPAPGVPVPPPPSPEQLAFQQTLKDTVNFEVSILNICYGAVKNFVAMNLRLEPLDSADIGKSMWGPGERTPLEVAQPQMTVEVYKSVRQSLREQEQQKPASERKSGPSLTDLAHAAADFVGRLARGNGSP